MKAPDGIRASRRAVTVVFLVHGVLFASWAAHVPQVKRSLGLSDGALGLALLGAPLGSVTAMLMGGGLIGRFGSRPAVRVAAAGYCLAGPLVGLAGSRWELFGALAVWGAFQGFLDVSMNTQGVTVERLLGRPILSGLHAGWSIGAAAGAGLGALAVAVGVGLTAQLTVLGLVALAVVAYAGRTLAADDRSAPGEHSGRPGLRLTPTLVTLGAIAFASLICEGAAADWSAVYLRESLGTGPGVAGLAYAAFTVTMVGVRLVGDRVMPVLGPRRYVSSLAAVATVVLAVGLATGTPVGALIGFAALGAGTAAAFPTMLGAAGRVPGVPPAAALTTVSTFGWAGFLCGPPLIGWLAGLTSLPVALGLVPVLTFLLTVGVRRTAAIDRAALTG